MLITVDCTESVKSFRRKSLLVATRRLNRNTVNFGFLNHFSMDRQRA